MLQSMLRFCSLEESLVADAMGTISRRRALLSDIKGRKAAGGKPSLLRGSTSSTASIADEEVEQDAIESDGLLDGSHMASGKAEGMTGKVDFKSLILIIINKNW